MNVTVELDNASSEPWVPGISAFRHWSQAALGKLDLENKSAEVSIRLIDEEESASLNTSYRNRSGSTNILSFPCDKAMIYPEAELHPLGDLAICAPVVTREAGEQSKALEAHWAHLTIHGILHLCGYDHENEEEASIMENLEIRILDSLGYDNPYE